CQQNAHWPLTF
nr:immunoglobulin light chain junction region [Macaca mulatta]MPN91417.1 immunoglobulin light chain junction region [Macaca mulatta]MPN91746.1 immunoglobulin light chain junction region [Macaca mulatta]MPN91817.1 immunoglobulin light chain junction region [Macaca mulatta]MPN93445.1 immunoglobulin light chain junction region [Macaca mulatta]